MRNPEANLTPKGAPVCKFAVDSNRFYKQEGIRQSEVSSFDVDVWSRIAETCEKHLKKGCGVHVVGEHVDTSTLPNDPRPLLSFIIACSADLFSREEYGWQQEGFKKIFASYALLSLLHAFFKIYEGGLYVLLLPGTNFFEDVIPCFLSE